MNSPDQLNFEAAAQISKPDEEPKKQVRRRRHSRRRLYKEVPLDMAEARREIVTALKLHRASSTKEAAREQQQKQDQESKQSFPLFPELGQCFEAEGRRKSKRNPRIYPSCSYDCSFYLENGSGFVAPPPENLNTEIPIQTFDDDFKTLDTCSSFCSLSFWPPPSSYICPTVSCPDTHHQEFPKSVSLREEEGNLMASDVFWFNNDPTGVNEKDMQQEAVLEEEAMAMAMDDLKSMSMDVKALEIDCHHSSDNAMEFPDWMSINDDSLQQYSNYHFVEEDCLQEPDLSCFDIGKIEDMGKEWLT
ncbi:uncharacterized protein LOC103493717 [Cucumis melo]|uniref:Uncharacterized protein LOC103493717 n=1 Tax=Cucumis melo TaxID=3656 RepID=A0A1S4DZY0_CUCME|nr:uncharacterized protein LOC103493717 [Cucumis melo]